MISFCDKFRPDYFIDTIYDIDARWLADQGISALIIDVDNTIMARYERQPHHKLRQWVKELLDSGVRAVAVSNNWTERVRKIAEELEVSLLAPAGKPLRPAFKRAIAQLGSSPDCTAILGDQLFTDILGGNRAGIRTVMVAPVSEIDLIHTKALRVFERIILNRLCDRRLVNGSWQSSSQESESGR